MQFPELLRLVRRGWVTLLATTLVGVAVGAVAFLTTTPVYEAKAQLFVAVKSVDEGSAVEVVQGSSAAQLKVKSYVGVITSSRVLTPVIDDLDLKTSPAALAGHVKASTPTNTVLIDLVVADTDPSRAAQIANSISKNFASVISNGIEAPTTGGSSPVSIDVLEPATVPTAASDPKLAVTLGLSVVLGSAAGLGLLLARRALDTRIHSKADLEAITDVPVIGTIGLAPDIDRHPLVVHSKPKGPIAESFRTLRTNLQFVDIGASERSFVITSAVPSEGKSTTAANLAVAIAETGASVVLVDGDLRRPRVAELMGIEGAAGLTDVLIGAAELDDLLQPWGNNGLQVLPAGAIPPNPSELLGSVGMQALLAELTGRFDVVLVDAPPLLPVTDAAVISRSTRGVIVVSGSKRATRAQFAEAIELLETIGSRALGLVATLVPSQEVQGYGSYGAYAAYYGTTASAAPLPNRPTARRSRSETSGPSPA